MAERAYVVEEARAELEPAPAAESPPTSESLPAPRIHLVPKEASAQGLAPFQSTREVGALVILSALLHAGVAYGYYTQEKAPPTRHVSKVDIEFARPPEPPKPKVAPPPPPPPPPEQRAKPLARPEEAPPQEEPPQPTNPVADTGSSAEAADDGNLFAGKGGLGVEPPAPPPAPKVAPPPAPVVAAREGANYSKNPRPGYPGRAVREGWEGEVLVRVQVQPNGRPGILKLQKSSGRTLLDDAALAAIKGWSFEPAKQGGQPVAGWVTVPIVFRLQ